MARGSCKYTQMGDAINSVLAPKSAFAWRIALSAQLIELNIKLEDRTRLLPLLGGAKSKGLLA